MKIQICERDHQSDVLGRILRTALHLIYIGFVGRFILEQVGADVVVLGFGVPGLDAHAFAGHESTVVDLEAISKDNRSLAHGCGHVMV